jgi:hypothetical protein
MLVLDGERGGPINNLTVISEVAPSYAPSGRSLVSVSLIGAADRADDEIEHRVRTQLEDWFGKQVTQWRLLRVYRVRQALPDLPPRVPDQPATIVGTDPRVVICGDHVAHGSIEGAMASGRLAAGTILERAGAVTPARRG